MNYRFVKSVCSSYIQLQLKTLTCTSSCVWFMTCTHSNTFFVSNNTIQHLLWWVNQPKWTKCRVWSSVLLAIASLPLIIWSMAKFRQAQVNFGSLLSVVTAHNVKQDKQLPCYSKQLIVKRYKSGLDTHLWWWHNRVIEALKQLSWRLYINIHKHKHFK